MIKIALLGMVTVILITFIKQEKQEWGILVGLACAIFMGVVIMKRLEMMLTYLDSFWSQLALGDEWLKLLLKTLGITYIADFSADVCKEYGNQTIAHQIDTFAKITILLVCVPGIEYLFNLMRAYLN